MKPKLLPGLACVAACLLSPLALRGQAINLHPIDLQFPDPGQSQGQGQGGAGNSIVGNWHQVQGSPDGGVTHTYWMFGPDGSFRESAVTIGGQSNGVRTQAWGHYQASPGPNGSLLVKTVLTGRAPLQLCMQGLGCRPTQSMAGTMQGYFQVRGNQFQTSGIVATRDNVPPVMLQQLPATWVLQPPPPLPAPPKPDPNGYNPPKYHVPGVNSCDNLQQQRICTVNNGTIYTDSNGCQICRAPY